MCALGKLVLDAEGSFDQALEIMGRWVGEAHGGTVEIYKDFGYDSLAAADADLLLKMAQAGKISDETLFKESKRRGLIDADETWEDEQARIESQGPAIANVTVGQ